MAVWESGRKEKAEREVPKIPAWPNLKSIDSSLWSREYKKIDFETNGFSIYNIWILNYAIYYWAKSRGFKSTLTNRLPHFYVYLLPFIWKKWKEQDIFVKEQNNRENVYIYIYIYMY